MASTAKKPKLVVIVGPTASGKSELALRTATLTPTEIICADSRTVYRYMDIGTAKPTLADRKKVTHWGLDLVEPDDNYSAAQYKNFAEHKIKDILNQAKLPLLVGGSGLYIDAVLYNFQFGPPAGGRRQALEGMDIEQLTEVIEANEWTLPSNKLNKRHLIRTVERQGQTAGRGQALEGSLIIGLMPADDVLRSRIDVRAEQIFKRGVISETKRLVRRYGREAIIRNGGIVYKICLQALDHEISEQTAATLFKTADWQYARRQKTWFKKNNDIVWFTDVKSAYKYLKEALNN